MCASGWVEQALRGVGARFSFLCLKLFKVHPPRARGTGVGGHRIGNARASSPARAGDWLRYGVFWALLGLIPRAYFAPTTSSSLARACDRRFPELPELEVEFIPRARVRPPRKPRFCRCLAVFARAKIGEATRSTERFSEIWPAPYSPLRLLRVPLATSACRV